MSKGKFQEKTKMVSLKSPPKGITIFLQMCMVQLKNTNWKAVKVQLNSIIDHNMLSVCHQINLCLVAVCILQNRHIRS